MVERLKNIIFFKISKDKDEDKFQSKIKSYIIIFFIIMITFTFLSKTADSFTVAQVKIQKASEKRLTFNVFGEGTIETMREQPISTLENIKVEDIFIKEGQYIEKNNNLFLLNSNDIDDKIFSIENDIKRLQLQLKQEDIILNRQEIQSEERARINLENLIIDKEYIESEQDYKIKTAENNLKEAYTKLDDIKKKYDEKLSKIKINLLDEKYEDYKQLELEYEEEKFSYNTQLKEAERKIQDISKELDRLKGNSMQREIINAMERCNIAFESGDDEQIKAADDYLNSLLSGENSPQKQKENVEDKELELKRVKDDYDFVKLMWESKLKDKENKLEKIQLEIKDIQGGEYDYTDNMNDIQSEIDNIEENIKNLKRSYEDSIVNKETALKNAQREIDKAQIELEQAIKSDINSNSDFENEGKKTALRKESIEIDLSEKNKKLNELKVIKDAGYIVTSPIDGIITSVSLEIGKCTSSEGIINVSKDGYIFKCKIDRDISDYMEIGDKITITFKGKKDKIDININSINYIEDENVAEITAIMPDGEFIPKMSVNFSIEKQTETYRMVVPIQAIHEDNISKYVLVIQENDTILGKEYISVRKEINLIDKDNINAAIDGSIFSSDDIIVDSNKNVGIGDRIRIAEQ